MQILTCLLIAFLYSNSFPQTTFYHGDYTLCTHMKGDKNTAADYCIVHNMDMDTLYSPSGGMDSENNRVFFVLFTNKPAFGMIMNGGKEEMRRIVLFNFNLESFFKSSEFESELEKVIKKKSRFLTGEWITNHLGKPTAGQTFENKTYNLVYKQYNIVLGFRNDILTSFKTYEVIKWL